MASLNSLEIKNALKSGITEVQVADTPVAIRLKYIGTGSITSVAFDTDQDITMVTSDGGTEEFLFATYTTMGSLADAINNSQYWNAKLVDALRSDLTSGSPFVNNLTASKTAAGYYDALVDTSVTKLLTHRCAYNRYPDGEDRVNSSKAKGSHRVHLTGFKYYCDNAGDEINGVQVWTFDPVNLTETQVYQATAKDITTTTITFASGQSEITSGWNHDLIVRIQDTAGTLANTSLRLEVSYDRE